MSLSSAAGMAGPASAASRRAALALALAALLVACGGGGGGDGASTPPADEVAGPPTAAATMVNSVSEAQSAARAVVAGADAAVNRVSSLNGFSVLVGGPVVPHGVATAPRPQVLGAARVQAQAVSTAACAELVDLPCSGSATLDTNIPDSATRVNPGDYADLQFAALDGQLFGQHVVMNGRVRIDFLSALDLNASQFNGLDLKLKLVGFGGSVNGTVFGPVSDTARLQINTQGGLDMTAGGVSYRGLHGVTMSGAGSYSIAGGTVRVSYWSDSGKYVDLSLQNWRVLGGRPAVGSQATVTTGQGSATISVSASSATAVVYAVSITNAGTTRYTVTASYPAGGGAPTYSAVLAP